MSTYRSLHNPFIALRLPPKALLGSSCLQHDHGYTALCGSQYNCMSCCTKVSLTSRVNLVMFSYSPNTIGKTQAHAHLLGNDARTSAWLVLSHQGCLNGWLESTRRTDNIAVVELAGGFTRASSNEGWQIVLGWGLNVALVVTVRTGTASIPVGDGPVVIWGKDSIDVDDRRGLNMSKERGDC